MTTRQPEPTTTPTIPNPGIVCTWTRPDRPIHPRDPSVHVSLDDPARFVVTVGAFGPIVRDVAERVFVSSADVPYPMAFAYVCSVVVAMVADDVAAEMS